MFSLSGGNSVHFLYVLSSKDLFTSLGSVSATTIISLMGRKTEFKIFTAFLYVATSFSLTHAQPRSGKRASKIVVYTTCNMRVFIPFWKQLDGK